jgi:hypothetical protein
MSHDEALDDLIGRLGHIGDLSDAAPRRIYPHGYEQIEPGGKTSA